MDTTDPKAKETEPRLPAAHDSAPPLELGKGYELGPDGVRELTAAEHDELRAAQPARLGPPHTYNVGDSAWLASTSMTPTGMKRAKTFVRVVAAAIGLRYLVSLGNGLTMPCEGAYLTPFEPDSDPEKRRLYTPGDVEEVT